MTICVAFSERAASSERLADVARRRPRGSVPPSSSTSSRCSSSSSADGAARPSCGTTWTATRSPFDALRDPRGAADEPLAVGRAGERDEDALARLPGLLDPVPLAVLGEALVDPVGEPEQRELAQRGEVARPEVVGERGVDPLGRVDVAAREPVAERLAASGRRAAISSARRTTSSGIVSRCLTPVICSTTSLSDSRCWMLSVEMTLMPASSSSSTSCQRFSLREPGTFVCASSSTSATCGRRASTASTSISSNVAPRYSIALARDDLEVADLLGRLARGRASRRSRRRRPRRTRAGAGPRSASRTSCRRRPRRRGRCGASLAPCAKGYACRRRARG